MVPPFCRRWTVPIAILLLLLLACTEGKDRLLDKMEPVKEEDAADYLMSFGYAAVSQLNTRADGLAGDLADVFGTAVRKFQEFANLPVTGVLDVKTRKKMAEPRCGMQDGVENLMEGGGAAFKWRKDDITYTFHNYSPDMPREQIKEAIRKAYGAWGAVTPLNFREVSPSEQADINILFASGMHDDPWPFDKKGGVLAHATMPPDGKLHFDEAESWVLMDENNVKSLKYSDLLSVAIHEGGHSLGLSHSKVEDAIMAPFYQEPVDADGNYRFPALKPDDIRAIQAIYGPRSGSRRVTSEQSAPPPPRGHQQSGGGGGRKSSGGGAAAGQSVGDVLWDAGKKYLKNAFMNWLSGNGRK